jgi:hypothetical protein
MATIYPTQDWLTASGAHAQANKIKRYWEARGGTVEVEVEEFRPDEGRKAVFYVRSDMVGGLPRRR